MGLNGTDIAIEPKLEEEILRVPKMDQGQASAPLATEDFALAPLVDKIAYGIARGLIVAVKELEHHIATETRKVGDSVDRRLDMLQITLQDLSRFVSEQQATNASVQGQLQDLNVGLRDAGVRHTAELGELREEAKALSASVSGRIDATVAAQQEVNARQSAEVAALHSETAALSQAVAQRIDSLSKDLSVHQEDIAALKSALLTFSSRVDALVERLDRQADAVRSMYAAYSQRETELEQLVDGLARLRAQPTPLPTNGL